MRVGVLAAFAMLSACGSDAPEPVTPISIKTQPKPEAKPAACIKVPEDEPGAIKHANGDATHVKYCVGTAVDQCFTLELANGKLTRLPEQPKAQSPAIQEPAHLETTNPELKVCNPNGCKTLTPQVWPGAAPLRAATNGSVAAVLLGDAEAGKGYVEVYDVMRTKKLATFKYARGEFKC